MYIREAIVLTLSTKYSVILLYNGYHFDGLQQCAGIIQLYRLS